MPELIDTSNPDKRNNLSIHMLKFQSKWQQQDNEYPREKFNKKKIRGGEGVDYISIIVKHGNLW